MFIQNNILISGVGINKNYIFHNFKFNVCFDHQGNKDDRKHT